MTAPLCPTCGTPARLTDGAEIYPHRPDLAAKAIWCCPVCPDTYVGCHKNTQEPLGTPAGPELRQARMRVHGLLDPFWQGTFGRAAGLTRTAVYGYLAAELGLTSAEMHVGRFTLDQCAAATTLLTGQTPLSILAATGGSRRTRDRQDAP